jgi:hypothetical protein
MPKFLPITFLPALLVPTNEVLDPHQCEEILQCSFLVFRWSEKAREMKRSRVITEASPGMQCKAVSKGI